MERVGELQSVHLGHRDVGEDHVWAYALYELETLPAVDREMDLVRCRSQRDLHQLPDRRVILYEDDPSHRGLSLYRLVARRKREEDVEGRSASHLALGPHPTAVHLHDLTHDRQPEAAALDALRLA